MCFTKIDKYKIAEQDIEVFKIGRPFGARFCSSIRDFYYEKNILYSKSKWLIFKAKIRNYLEGEVYHAFRTIRMTKNFSDVYHIGSRRFHESFIGKFIVPKGAIYWENDYRDEIASTQIKYLGTIEEVNKEKVINDALDDLNSSLDKLNNDSE